MFNTLSLAQQADCNRTFWIKQYEKEFPNDICIPKGYLVSYIYQSTDVNGDKISDFIFSWQRVELQDGDTTYVSIYLQNKEGSFSYFRTFSNLYPLYFKSYESNYIPKSDELAAVHTKYEGQYLFLDLEFEEEVITIKVKHEAKEDLWVKYRYDKNKKDWLYLNAELHDYALDRVTSTDLSKKLGPSIKKFNYFYWEDEE